MKLLFEGFAYSPEMLEGILPNQFFSSRKGSEKAVVDYVGYYYNPQIEDMIIVLPKVFIYENTKAFGLFFPEDLINFNKETRDELKLRKCHDIVLNISTWLYQAIVQYRKREQNTSIVRENESFSVISNLKKNEVTELDLVLSLIDFYKRNKALITYTTKLANQGKKTNWKKTISKNLPIITDNTPIYPLLTSYQREVNVSEELLMLFYSALNHFVNEYGFSISFSSPFMLIKGRAFQRFQNGKGTRYLKNIKYKYFSDKFLQLWKLLYAYFEKMEESKRSNKRKQEILMVRNFNIIFEDMIDVLIGDDSSDIPRYFAEQLDGKRVDHLYQYQSLILNDDIYFVGDSKYYKPENNIHGQSIAKQFTYAKNVIQYNVDLFNKNKLPHKIRYRDDLTEGYNITPNFFISALVNKDFNFFKDDLKCDKTKSAEKQFHFKDRLFDRDTLFIQSYNINFLFVLAMYISRSAQQKNEFKEHTHQTFRKRMIDFLNEEYSFYKIKPITQDLEYFVEKYFKFLNGKSYRPSNMEDSLILALSKQAPQNLPFSESECDITTHFLD